MIYKYGIRERSVLVVEREDITQLHFMYICAGSPPSHYFSCCDITFDALQFHASTYLLCIRRYLQCVLTCFIDCGNDVKLKKGDQVRCRECGYEEYVQSWFFKFALLIISSNIHFVHLKFILFTFICIYRYRVVYKPRTTQDCQYLAR